MALYDRRLDTDPTRPGVTPRTPASRTGILPMLVAAAIVAFLMIALFYPRSEAPQSTVNSGPAVQTLPVQPAPSTAPVAPTPTPATEPAPAQPSAP